MHSNRCRVLLAATGALLVLLPSARGGVPWAQGAGKPAAPAAPGAAKKDPKSEYQTRWAALAKKLSKHHTALGKTFEAKKMHELARTEWLHAVTLDPTNADAQRSLGRKQDKGKTDWIEDPSAKPAKNAGTADEVKQRLKECAEERETAGRKVVPDLTALAVWADANGLKDLGNSVWRRLLRDYDAKNERALEATGWVLDGDDWVSPADVVRRESGRKALEGAVEGEDVNDPSDVEKATGLNLRKRRSANFLLEGAHSDEEMRNLMRCCEAARNLCIETFHTSPTTLSNPIHGVFVESRADYEKFIDKCVDADARQKDEFKRLGGFRSASRMTIADFQGELPWADIRDDAVHMSTHFFFSQITRLKHEPAWLREGFAYWMTERLTRSASTLCLPLETGVGSERRFVHTPEWSTILMDGIADGTSPPLRSVMLVEMASLSPPKMIKAWSVIDFLLTDHMDEFFAFIAALREEKTQEEALKIAFKGLGPEGIEAMWLAKLRGTP